MAGNKRTIQGYEEMYAVRFGGKEVIIAENKNAEARYMVCDCKRNNSFGLAEYSNAEASVDFVEIMKVFVGRLTESASALETERELRGIPHQILTAADCEPKSADGDFEGRVVVIKAERLAPEYRSIDNQLAVATGGFGCNPTASGRKVYCQNLISGETEQWNRADIAGTAAYDKLPEWARVNFDALRQSAGKESVIEKIKRDKQDKQQTGEPNPKTKKHKKDRQEL